MIQIHGSKDCGNSPKNKFVQEITIALETGKAQPEYFSEDVVWENASGTPVHGRNALVKELAARPEPAAIIVLHAISHGKVGAANGEVTFGDGGSRRFSYIFEFTNTNASSISLITSYS